MPGGASASRHWPSEHAPAHRRFACASSACRTRHLGTDHRLGLRRHRSDHHSHRERGEPLRDDAGLALQTRRHIGARPSSTAPTRTRVSSEASTPDDVVQLGALLYSNERMMPISALAEVLSWPKARVRAAADALDARLRDCGRACTDHRRTLGSALASRRSTPKRSRQPCADTSPETASGSARHGCCAASQTATRPGCPRTTRTC